MRKKIRGIAMPKTVEAMWPAKEVQEWAPKWDDQGPTDDLVNTAMGVLRAEYWASIRSMGKSIADEVRAGNVLRRNVSDAIHEACDQCYWTIYTAASQRAVLASDHDWSDSAEEFGDKEKGSDALRAYYCVSHDVTAQVEAELGDETEEEETVDEAV